MPTKEIRKENWNCFLNEFSKQHDGAPVSIDLFSPMLGAQTEIKALSFKGLSLESRQCEDTVEVMAGTDKDRHLTHTLKGVRHIRLNQITSGMYEILEIQSEHDTLLIRFNFKCSTGTL
jgi:hypothetical protein